MSGVGPFTKLFDTELTRRRLTGLTVAGVAAAFAPSLALRNALAQESGGEFVIANDSDIIDLLPFFNGFGPAIVMRQIYEPLAEPRMELADDGSVNITFTPVLAESWERVDETRWRFNLRQGVTFHNGEPWNADAALASYNAMGDAELTNKLAKINMLRAISSAEIVDDYTIDFVTPEPDPELLGLVLRLGFVGLPAGMLADQGLEAFADNPVGTGPYRFESWTQGQDFLMTSYVDYWDPNGPKMAAIRSIPRPEAAVRAQTIAAGESQFAFNIGAEQAATLDASITGGGFQTTGIRLNNTIAPTNDKRVREAINYAIDRDAIVEAIFGGQAKPAAFFGFQPVTLDPWPYDPEKGAALIDEAGVAGTEIELVYGETRIPEEDQLAEIYQASLESIGLKVKLTKVERAQYNEASGAPFEQQPAMLMETTSSGNYADVASGLEDKYGCEGSGTYCNPDMDAAFKELYLLDGEARNARLQEIADQLTPEASRAWVAIVQQVHGLGEGVTTDLSLNAYVRLQDISVQ